MQVLAHGDERDGRVRCSAWLVRVVRNVLICLRPLRLGVLALKKRTGEARRAQRNRHRARNVTAPFGMGGTGYQPVRRGNLPRRRGGGWNFQRLYPNLTRFARLAARSTQSSSCHAATTPPAFRGRSGVGARWIEVSREFVAPLNAALLGPARRVPPLRFRASTLCRTLFPSFASVED